jgi:hypothetical protein
MSLRELQEEMLTKLYETDTDVSLKEFSEFMAQNTELKAEDISGEGWRLTHLILMKLRFERLNIALPEMEQMFKDQKESFMQMFYCYHRKHPSKTFFPAEEAEVFIKFYHEFNSKKE